MAPDEAAAVVQRGDVSEEWVERVQAFMVEHGSASGGGSERGNGTDGPKFSHAWVVGGKKTTTGSAVLVSDPQTPVGNPSLFYEFHLRGKTIDARGIGVAGSPVILIGFNRHVAWGMTALGADQADLFRLETDDDHPDQYRFDGQWRKMEVLDEIIKVKGGRPIEHRVRLTHLGPVVTRFAFARPGEGEVAVKRVPMCETDRETIQGAVAMMRAGDVDAFSVGLAGWRFPSANVVYGDDQGNVGYHVVAAIPIRATDALEHGGAAHDGTGAKYDWQGMVPHALLPQVVNPARGYIYSANHRPIGSFYPIPLGTSTGSLGHTLRSWRLDERLAAKERFTPADVLDVHYDDVNPARRAIVAVGFHLRDVLKRELSPEASRALGQLEPWREAGSRSDLAVPGAALAGEINTMFRIMQTELTLTHGGGLTGLSRFGQAVEKRLRDDPRAEIKPLEQEYVDRSLAGAWRQAVNKYGPDPERWSERARGQVRQRRLGFYHSLDGFGSLDARHDVSVPALACVDGNTIRSQAAQAYTQYVPLHDVDQARSILPIGQSERIGDPSRQATRDLWAAGELHPAPLSRKAVETIARSRKQLLP